MAPQIISHLPYFRDDSANQTIVILAMDAAASNLGSKIVPIRKQPMSTFDGVMDAATRNADTSSDIALAAGRVIAKRVALGVAAAFDPLGADHVEFGRMVPEKIEAFSAAGMIVLEQSNQASWELTRLASDEVMTTACATLAIAGCVNPVAMAEAQGQFALAWINRATSNFFAMGIMALGVQQAAMAPIQQTVAANTERLCC